MSRRKEDKLTIAANIYKPGSTTRNKTGAWRTFRPVIDKKKCKKCGICWQYCPDNAISQDFKVNYDYCKGCLICVEECPFKAIRVEKEEK